MGKFEPAAGFGANTWCTLDPPRIPMTADKTIRDLRRRVGELTEENARLIEQVTARDNFLAFAAHELRNPMAPIISRISLLRRAVAQGALSQEKLAQSLEHLDWLMTLFVKRATTLLDVSRMTSGQLQLEQREVDVCEVARAVVRAFEPQAKYSGSLIGLDLPAGGLSVLGDPLAIEEILENLVSNAVKYGDGKPIFVSLSSDAASSVARISVKDGGPGISPENQARIFERFERAVPAGGQAGGFGVGLWIVKQLVEAMKGSIVVTSSPGVGSTFCITLPLMPVTESE
jgi:signal transduction histidine kinase